MRLRVTILALTVGLLTGACSGSDTSARQLDTDVPVTDSSPTSSDQASSVTTDSPSTTATVSTTATAATSSAEAAPTASVSAEQTFEVETTSGIVYAQAVVHADWNDDETEVVDLTLDVFEPVDAPDTPRPVIVMIHGGSFVSGSSSMPQMTNMASYFASRGWVAFSINYRLGGDHGTLPSSFPVPADPDPARAESIQAFYPACRDAKAAIRWIRANADTFGLDTDRITAIGGSAGSVIAVALGVINESDCKDELTTDEDPTLATTNLDQSSEIHTVIDHWGAPWIVTTVEVLNGGGSRFDASDAPISIVHGTDDTVVDFALAEELEAAYAGTGVPYRYYPLPGAGHAPWRFELDGRSLAELAFDFIVEQQELAVN